MTVKTGSLRVGASIAWELEKTVSGFQSAKQGPDSLSFAVTPSAATYNEVLLATGAIAAAANVVIDFRTFNDAFGAAKTGTGVLGFLLKATGNTGILKIEPGATDPLTWFFGGTTPSISLNCGASGCAILLADGSSATVSATAKNIKLSNTGLVTITYFISALVDA